MAQLDRLIRDARKSMRAHNHIPMPATRSMAGGAAVIKCANCTMEAYVVCKPAPNDSQISGEAVALTCNCNVATPKIRDVKTSIHSNGDYSMEAVVGC